MNYIGVLSFERMLNVEMKYHVILRFLRLCTNNTACTTASQFFRADKNTYIMMRGWSRCVLVAPKYVLGFTYPIIWNLIRTFNGFVKIT